MYYVKEAYYLPMTSSFDSHDITNISWYVINYWWRSRDRLEL